MSKKHVIELDPEKDKQVRQLFRSISPQFSARSMSPKVFRNKVYPKFTTYLEEKEAKLQKKRSKKDRQFIKSIEQWNYSQMWDKSVVSNETRTFLQRTQNRIREMWDRQARNELQKSERHRREVLECTFRPEIDQRAKSIGPRSIRDLYEWDDSRIGKRRTKQREKQETELGKCRGKFKPERTRKQILEENKL